MKQFSLILLIIVYSSCTFAVCPKPITYLQEGQQAACAGYLFTPTQEAVAREAVTKYVTAQELILQQDALIANQDKRIALETARYANIKAALDSKNDQTQWERILWFSAGFVIGGGIIYAARK